MHYFAPTISFRSWIPEDDALIIRKVQESGTKWAEIGRTCPDGPTTQSRTDATASSGKPPKTRNMECNAGKRKGESEPVGTEKDDDCWDRQLAEVSKMSEDTSKGGGSGMFSDWFSMGTGRGTCRLRINDAEELMHNTVH
jgi:hypothetical protein